MSKRGLAVVLVCAMVLCMTACGSKSKSEDRKDKSPASSTGSSKEEQSKEPEEPFDVTEPEIDFKPLKERDLTNPKLTEIESVWDVPRPEPEMELDPLKALGQPASEGYLPKEVTLDLDALLYGSDSLETLILPMGTGARYAFRDSTHLLRVRLLFRSSEEITFKPEDYLLPLVNWLKPCVASSGEEFYVEAQLEPDCLRIADVPYFSYPDEGCSQWMVEYQDGTPAYVAETSFGYTFGILSEIGVLRFNVYAADVSSMNEIEFVGYVTEMLHEMAMPVRTVEYYAQPVLTVRSNESEIDMRDMTYDTLQIRMLQGVEGAEKVVQLEFTDAYNVGQEYVVTEISRSVLKDAADGKTDWVSENDGEYVKLHVQEGSNRTEISVRGKAREEFLQEHVN